MTPCLGHDSACGGTGKRRRHTELACRRPKPKPCMPDAPSVPYREGTPRYLASPESRRAGFGAQELGARAVRSALISRGFSPPPWPLSLSVRVPHVCVSRLCLSPLPLSVCLSVCLCVCPFARLFDCVGRAVGRQAGRQAGW